MTTRTSGAEEFVRLGSLRLRVRRTGEGPPLLLINGIGAAIEMLEPLTSRLDGYEVIAFDLPGTGRSSLPRLPMRMKQIGLSAAELVGVLGHQQVDVLGYSFGGAVAQEMAYRAPQSVRRLILCATTPGMPAIPPSPLVVAMMLTPARYYSAGLASFIVPRIAGGRTARNRDVLAAGIAQRQRHPPSLLGYAFQLSATAGWTSQPWLHRLRAQTLVIHGDDDPVAPLVNARWMAHRIPQAQLHVIRGGGHLFLLDQPDAALPAIRSFLSADPYNRQGGKT